MTEEIKSKVKLSDLFDVLGVRVRGKHASCPLHEDKKPSMAFSDDKGLWYCFVCSTGGDVITLVMKTQGLDFKESIKWLNDKFYLGITNEKPKRNHYLEALNENYQILKECLENEFQENCNNHYRLMDLSRGLNYKYLFWEADDFTFEYTYEEKQELIQSKLRELENARYKLRRTASQTVADNSRIS